MFQATRQMMRVQVVDPSAYTPPYDHALCSGLAALDVDVELVTSRFQHGEVPDPEGYRVREVFYRHSFGAPGSLARSLSKLVAHPAGMARLRRIARDADVVHFQWLPVQWLDVLMLPSVPLVLTAHDLLPREARLGQARAQRRLYDTVDAVIVHSEHGRRVLSGLGVDPAKLHVVHHGAFEHVTAPAVDPPRLPPELAQVRGPVVLFFGLVRPYKGVEVLLDAWRRLRDRRGELWVVGQPRVSLEPLRRRAGPGVRFVPRFVSEHELRAVFARADVVVLPYLRTERLDQSGVLAIALAFGKATIVSDVGSFPEVASAGAAKLVPPGDAAALAEALGALVADPVARERLEMGARVAAEHSYSWREAAAKTLRVYEEVAGVRRDPRGDPIAAARRDPPRDPPQSRPR